MNSAADESIEGRTLERFYAYKDTFDRDSFWVDIPRAITFVNILDPFAMSSSPEPEEEPGQFASDIHELEVDRAIEHQHWEGDEAHTAGLEALSAAALYKAPENTLSNQKMQYPDDPFGSMRQSDAPENDTSARSSPQPEFTYAPTSGNLGLISNLSETLYPAGGTPIQNQFGSLHGVPGMARTREASREHFEASTETSHKTAFLLRHFSEVIGRWMDLFDQASFFCSHIPVKSISNPLLKHAACAYAAKHLGRVNGVKDAVVALLSRQADMEQWEHHEDWPLVAAQHYDHAISLLVVALQLDQISSEADSSSAIDKRHYAPKTVDGMVEERRLRRRQFCSAQSTARSDDVLAATAILCEYESLDASTAAWTRHLSGTKTLLDIVEVGMMPLDNTIAPEISRPSYTRKPSQARKAIFWNFARQDLFAAFLYECRTRLDTDDVRLWREAGLLLNEDDLVVSSNTLEPRFSEHDMREDMLGNALIWLVSKLMNLICASSGPDAPLGTFHPQDAALGSANTDVTPESLSARWHRLNQEMEAWFTGLPETFMPSAIIPVHPHGTNLTEVWHSIPVCAATTLTWHFAQILILVNKPHNVPTRRRTTITDRVNSYRNIESEIAFHSRQILGLCLARPDASVRIHALHPLFVAGQCLAEPGERRVVVDLLRGIEKDLGWATEYRVQQLLGEWGWQTEGDG